MGGPSTKLSVKLPVRAVTEFRKVVRELAQIVLEQRRKAATFLDRTRSKGSDSGESSREANV